MTIDVSKLSRDYREFPVFRNEGISFDDLYYLFFDVNLSREEVASYMGTSVAKVRKHLTKYGFKKSVEQYQKKVRQTNLIKYGVEHPLQKKEIWDKTAKTVKEKYGVDNVFQSERIKEKAKNTCLEKYGVENAQQNKEIKEKTINTLRQKYGVSTGYQLHVVNKDIWYNNNLLTDFIKKGNNGKKWRTVELAEIFNLSIQTVQSRIGELNLWFYIDSNTSSFEEEVRSLIKSWGFSADKYQDGYFSLDIYIKEKNIAIEVNDNYWHSTRVRNDNLYHKKKSEEALKRGIFVYHLFEYEWVNNKEVFINHLKNLLGLNTISIFARKCSIGKVDRNTATSFLNKNHIQGTSASTIRLGLFYNDELVSLMTFEKSRFNKNYQYELVRFCSKSGCNVVGGASKLFKYFINYYKPTSVISYSNICKTRGTLYTTLGFNEIGITYPDYVWTYNGIVLTKYQCRKQLLIKRGFGHLGNTEKEIMESRNFSQIYDCGLRVHSWTSSED